MSLFQTLLPDRICKILHASSPAGEQGGVRGSRGERTSRPTVSGSACERARPRGPNPTRASDPWADSHESAPDFALTVSSNPAASPQETAAARIAK